MADGRVVISTALDNTGLKKGISGISGQLGGLQNAIKGIGAAVGIAFGLKALFNFGKAAVEVGSDIAEVQNVVDVAFGDMAYKAENFAATAIESFGMSRLSAKKTASTYMAMAKGMGMNENAASDMAISLAGLTGDVASFFNISQEMADIKLKSVFTGETESLKDLGVVMTQTNLKAYALSQGITKDITTMTQAELVSLRYGFVMDQLALAQGDFARTSDSWANQTRILSERWKEFMSIIGQALITVLTPLVKVLNSIVAGLINMANTFNEVITSIFGGAKTQIQQTAAQTSGVESAIGGSVGNQKDLTKEVKKTSKAAKGAVAAFDELNVLTRIDSGDGDSGGSGILGAAGGGVTIATANPEETISPFVERVLKLLEPLKEISFDNLIDSFNRLKAAVTPLVRSLFDGLMWAYEKIFVPLSKWTIEEVLPRFLNLLSQVLLFLGSVIDACKPGIQWLWDNLLQPIAEWTGGIFLMVIDEISWAIGELTLWFEENGEEISNIIRGIGEVLKYVWDTIRPKLEAAIELVQAIFRRLVTYITGRLDSLVDILSGVEPLYAEYLSVTGRWPGKA